MKIAIAQPTYFPWIGYFDLIDQVDQFVLLDSVQFEKQSWQQRNRIKGPTGLQWLTIPVVFRGRLEQLIRDVELRESDFLRTHLRALELNYRRAPFFEEYYKPISSHMRSLAATNRLVELTAGFISWFLETLGLNVPVVRSSRLSVTGKRTELLANICQALGAAEYLSPLGSASYLIGELPTMTSRGISVAFQHYEHPEYTQQFPPFRPYAGIVDLLFNEGSRALEIIRSGRRAAYRPQDAAHLVAEGA